MGSEKEKNLHRKIGKLKAEKSLHEKTIKKKNDDIRIRNMVLQKIAQELWRDQLILRNQSYQSIINQIKDLEETTEQLRWKSQLPSRN